MIDLRHNKIESIPQNLFDGNNFQNLKTLDLSYNQILEFELWPFYLNRISINLMNNSISELTNKFKLDINSFVNTCHNKNISLENNKIQNFNDETLRHYNVTDFKNQTKCFEQLTLRNNPIKCNCFLQSQLIRHSRSFIENICKNSDSSFIISECGITTSSTKTRYLTPSISTSKTSALAKTSTTTLIIITPENSKSTKASSTSSSTSKMKATSKTITKAITNTKIVITTSVYKSNTTIHEKITKLTTTLPIITSINKKNLTNNTDVKVFQEKINYQNLNDTTKKPKGNNNDKSIIIFIILLLLILIIVISVKVFIEKKKRIN